MYITAANRMYPPPPHRFPEGLSPTALLWKPLVHLGGVTSCTSHSKPTTESHTGTKEGRPTDRGEGEPLMANLGWRTPWPPCQNSCLWPHHTLGCFHPPSLLPTTLWVTPALWSNGSLSLAQLPLMGITFNKSLAAFCCCCCCCFWFGAMPCS